MRILVFLNPTNKHGTKTEYTAFRKTLLKMGFLQVQPEVFMRVVSSSANDGVADPARRVFWYRCDGTRDGYNWYC